MKYRLKVLIALLLGLFFFLPLPSVKASADSGPKPSIHVNFKGMGEELCYGTLLSKNSSTGLFSAWRSNVPEQKAGERYGYDDLDYAVWKAFVEYDDEDGYYFLQRAWTVSETASISWTYYPPYSFKVLLYFPERNVFASGKIRTRYAFDSYFTVDISSLRFPESGNGLSAPIFLTSPLVIEESYDFTLEILSLISRIILTVLLELLISLLFGLREKKPLLFITGVNAFTQILLNVLLNVVNYRSGQWEFVTAYVLLELTVFLIEAIVYAIFINKCSKNPKRPSRYVGYAFTANLISFIGGLLLARIIPGIF